MCGGGERHYLSAENIFGLGCGLDQAKDSRTGSCPRFLSLQPTHTHSHKHTLSHTITMGESIHPLEIKIIISVFYGLLMFFLPVEILGVGKDKGLRNC